MYYYNAEWPCAALYIPEFLVCGLNNKNVSFIKYILQTKFKYHCYYYY